MTRTTADRTDLAALQDATCPALPRQQVHHAIAKKLSRLTLTVVSVSVVGFASSSLAAEANAHKKIHPKSHRPAARQVHRQVSTDHHVGFASYYAHKFSGRRMADGTPMRPESDNAASPTLPLGSKAMVTNLLNGRSALVTIRDRGPFVKGRIIDVSPSTAKLLGILQAGVARVAVIPLEKFLAQESVHNIVAAADSAIETAVDLKVGNDSP
ncbi:MAG: septal ring lytic transglycosylase RlpA family protein [Ideonella sp.]